MPPLLFTRFQSAAYRKADMTRNRRALLFKRRVDENCPNFAAPLARQLRSSRATLTNSQPSDPCRIKGPRPRSVRWQCGKHSHPARDHRQIRADPLIVDCLNLRGLNLAISYADRCGFRYSAFARFSVRLPAFALRVLCVPSLYLSGLLMRPALPASREPIFPLRAYRATRRLVSRPIP
jgi:hypothetical protein